MQIGPLEGKAAKKPRGRPPSKSVRLIEEELLAVALQEFIQEGYGGASLSRIVKAARISKTTLYSRYKSKEELFRAIMGQQVEPLSLIGTLTASTPFDPTEGLKAYANRTLTISLEGDLLAVNRLIYSEAYRFPELGLAAAERTQVGIAQIAWFLEQCKQSGCTDCAEPRDCAEAFILMLRGWYVNAMLSSREVAAKEREEWVARMVPVFIAGCRK